MAQYANELETSEMQELFEGRLVGRMLLQRLAAGATGVKQARSGYLSSVLRGYTYAYAPNSVCRTSVTVHSSEAR